MLYRIAESFDQKLLSMEGLPKNNSRGTLSWSVSDSRAKTISLLSSVAMLGDGDTDLWIASQLD